MFASSRRPTATWRNGSNPGNVRELENAIERAVVAAKLTLREAVAALQMKMLANALAETRGNCARAGRELGITERVVRYEAAPTASTSTASATAASA
jgi:transcriptional regulator with GAF, ATPase, and Fis domain